jgi:LPS sulfotransferase NodH
MASVTHSPVMVKAEARSAAPVFVLGCPRSGTTLLYHMLLSAGGFAVYRSESNVFNILAPRFGKVSSQRNRERLVNSWLRSKFFRVADLKADDIRAKILAECRTPGEFLRVTMEAVARKQGVRRWADCTPDHILYVREIKREIPDALIIHIIRDGRDVALSFAQQGWSHPLPWDRPHQLGVAALYWSWVVDQGRKCGLNLGADYTEVRYEELVENPRGVLKRLSQFIGQELDYETVVSVGIGSVRVPNTSFEDDASGTFKPVGRWKAKLSTSESAMLECLIGQRLQELGYPVGQELQPRSIRCCYMRQIYPRLFATKFWLKNKTFLGWLTDIGPMELTD